MKKKENKLLLISAEDWRNGKGYSPLWNEAPETEAEEDLSVVDSSWDHEMGFGRSSGDAASNVRFSYSPNGKPVIIFRSPKISFAKGNC